LNYFWKLEKWKSKHTDGTKSSPFLEFSKQISSTFGEGDSAKIVENTGRTNISLATVEAWKVMEEKKKKKSVYFYC
jgi:hypothetical protein